jgi:hypothetical protein
MAKERQYRALSGTDEDDGREKAWSPGEDDPRSAGSRSAFALCVAALLLSLAVNVLFAVDNTRLRTTARDRGQTKYSRLPNRLSGSS